MGPGEAAADPEASGFKNFMLNQMIAGEAS